MTFLVAIPAMLPLYERLGMDRRMLACVAALAAGVMNFLPWSGPTLRASAALKLPVTELFNPLLPVLAVGLVYVFAVVLRCSAGERSAARGCRGRDPTGAPRRRRR